MEKIEKETCYSTVHSPLILRAYFLLFSISQHLLPTGLLNLSNCSNSAGENVIMRNHLYV
uniref:Uncharacterized protein n=1 Tax=Arundo donax TaxID=35708 RepID=A0A0A9ATK4_ARUDO